MHITVRIVHDWKKIEMDVQRLSISAVQGRICSMRGENLGKLDLFLVVEKLKFNESSGIDIQGLVHAEELQEFVRCECNAQSIVYHYGTSMVQFVIA